MTLTPAPFYADLAEAPAGARAYWTHAEDGLRLRVAHVPSQGRRGTVLMFPGRTEYVEKYGRLAADLGRAGFDMVSIDWRGQGLADRLLEDRKIGHVNDFLDYQKDVAAMLKLMAELDLPQPYHLIGHSMGGCIGLRAVMSDLPVVSAAFTGPMWGIGMSAPMRPAAWALSWSSRHVGLSHVLTPGTTSETYVVAGEFNDNTLTSDPEMWDYMRRQSLAQPELQLAGPSMQWLHEALSECLALARKPSPSLPCLTFLGANERIVDTDRIHDRMRRWPGGRLVTVDGAEHEILMERPDIRNTVIGDLIAHFDQAQARSQASQALSA